MILVQLDHMVYCRDGEPGVKGTKRQDKEVGVYLVGNEKGDNRSCKRT